MQPEPSETFKKASVSKTSSRSPSSHQHGLLRSSSSASHGSSRGREPGSAAATTPRHASPRSDSGGDKEQGDSGILRAAADDDDDGNEADDAMTLKSDAGDKSPKTTEKPQKAPSGSSPIVKLPNGALLSLLWWPPLQYI